jgi:NADPH2 dehydrogenase
VTAELEKRAQHGNRFAYVHVVEPRDMEDTDRIGVSNQFVVGAGAMYDAAEQEAEKDPNSLIALGRYFISNPDLVDLLEKKQNRRVIIDPPFMAAPR